jgi:DNA-binding XRE family transcriptional regulator
MAANGALDVDHRPQSPGEPQIRRARKTPLMNERRVGRALRAIRQARRLRQGDVAAAAGVSRATV